MSKSGLDITSLFKINQKLSQEVQLADLLSAMIGILLENSGAESALVLYQTEGTWFVEASGQVKDQLVQTMMHVPLAKAAMLSPSVCNEVIRSGQPIVLDNAAENPQFAADAYLQAHVVKSLLCLPIWHQDKLELVLYLENNLVEGAFTEDRLELLRLLSGQMAISLENALMVDGLKASIVERERAEMALRESEDRLTTLATLANELSKVQTLDELYRRSVEAGRERLGFDRVALWFFAEDHMSILGTYGTDAEGNTTDERTSRHPIRETSGLHAIADANVDLKIYRNVSLYQDGTKIGIGERLAVGLWDGEAAIGFLSVDNLIHRQPFTDRDCELLRLYAVSLGHLINLKRAQNELAQLAETLEQRVVQRTAQLRAANKELEAFSYSVSHDLRAPLRAIDGYTRILTRDYQAALDAEGRRVCGVVRSQTQRMAKLIDDLLAFSRLSRVETQTSLIDMEMLVNSVFRDMTTAKERERIDFQQESLPPAVGDPALIRQVWINLLSNACKFSAKREQAVIRVGSSQDGEADCYYVRDNGAGFDMQYADKLFGVFQRLHSDREFDGTGVGLAIVQRIVHRHGGKVWAEAEADKGATFYFTLPRNGN